LSEEGGAKLIKTREKKCAIILILSSPSCDRGVGLVVPLRPLSLSLVLAVSPDTVVVHRHVINSPVLPASRGSQRQVWVLGNSGVGAQHGCCFEKQGGQRWLLGTCGWCIPYGYLIGWASLLSSQPVVVILVLLSPSHPFGWGGGDARFGRPSWVGTK
jgi:hypothetical protein